MSTMQSASSRRRLSYSQAGPAGGDNGVSMRGQRVSVRDQRVSAKGKRVSGSASEVRSREQLVRFQVGRRVYCSVQWVRVSIASLARWVSKGQWVSVKCLRVSGSTSCVSGQHKGSVGQR